MRAGHLAHLVVGVALFSACKGRQPDSTPPDVPHTSAPPRSGDTSNLPIGFEANAGQTDAAVRFLVHGGAYNLFLTPRDAMIVLTKEEGVPEGGRGLWDSKRRAAGAAVRLTLAGAQAVEPTGIGRLAGKSNYLIGNDPAAWLRDVSRFARVEYPDVLPGVDLVWYGSTRRELEFDVVLAPGADPAAIRLRLEGIDGLALDAAGNLEVETHGGRLLQRKPVAYQAGVGAHRKEVAASYFLAGDGSIGFSLGEYDRERPLVIDPSLQFMTTLGGASNEADAALDIAVDSAGDVYLTGRTQSPDFPTTPGAFDRTLSGLMDVFVTKLSADGSSIVYSTYVGGTASPSGFQAEFGGGIAVDASGRAVVTGAAATPDFPTVNPLQATFHEGGIDAFLMKLSPDGSSLVFSTFLGGSSRDQGNDVALDAAGSAYVTGYTLSPDFPVANAFQSAIGSITSVDAFVSKVAADGSALVYSTYLGGFRVDVGDAIAVDGSGSAFVTGFTTPVGSGDTPFPTQSPFQADPGGELDAFITKLSPDGSTLVYSTYLGGTADDAAGGIAVDPAGNAFVTGSTYSSNFPTVSPFQGSRGGVADAFVTKLAPDGDSLVYSTYFGGSSPGSTFFGAAFDGGESIAIDASGNALVVGSTNSTNLPTKEPFQGAYQGGFEDAFVMILASDGAGLVFSTYLGTSIEDSGHGIAADAFGNAYVAGFRGSDAFVAKFIRATARADAFSTDEDAPLAVAAPGVLANDDSVDRALLATPPSHAASFTLGLDGSFLYVPAPDFHGSDSFTYRASDGENESPPATVTLTIQPANDAPVANADGYAVGEDAVLDVAAPGVLVNDTDVDGDALLASLVAAPEHGFLALADNGSFSYTPAPDFYGSDSFTYRASDGGLLSSVASVSLTIVPAEDFPVARDDSATAPEDESVPIAVLANDSGLGDAPLTVAIVSAPLDGDALVNPDGTIRYTPDPDFAGGDTIVYSVTDVDGDSASARVTLMVTEVSDLPVAQADAAATSEDAAVTIDVLANDTGLVDPPITVTVTAAPADGTTTVLPGGSITYEPDADFFGADLFTYHVTDGDGDFATATVSVSVSAVNDAPRSGGFLLVTAAAGVPVEIPLLGTDVDVDDCELGFLVSSPPTRGSIGSVSDLACTPGSPNIDRATITYLSTEGGFDELTYVITDGELSAAATVSIVIAASETIRVEAHTLASAAGAPASEHTVTSDCASGACTAASADSSEGPLAGSSSLSQARRGELAALAEGRGSASATAACFGSRGFSSFTVTDLVFSGPEPTVCPAALNLQLSGLIDVLGGSGRVQALVGVDGEVGANSFTGEITLTADGGVTTDTRTGILAGVADESNVRISTPGFCVPTGTPLTFFLRLRTIAAGDATAVSGTPDALADFSNTLQLESVGPVFDLPPGYSVAAPSLQLDDNRWLAARTAITVDLKPGGFPNSVNCLNENAVLPVAILSTPTFDARTLDHTTVDISGGHEMHVGKRHENDVDGDGDLDLLVHVRLGETTLTCASQRIEVAAATFGGERVEGSDSIRMVQPGGPNAGFVAPQGESVPGAVASAATSQECPTFEQLLDADAPETTIVTGPSDPTNDATPRFTFEADEAASFECSLDGAAFASCTSALIAGPLADGVHLFQVRATDAIGNVDPTPASATFLLDQTPPALSLDSPANGATVFSSPTEVRILSENETVTVTASNVFAAGTVLPGGTVSVASVALAQGSNTFSVAAVDAAGNFTQLQFFLTLAAASTGSGSVPLWTMRYGVTDGGTNKALVELTNANGHREHAWTFTDSNATRVLSEQGPGMDPANALTFTYLAGQTEVTFQDSSGTTRTNIYGYSSEFSGGERPRVTSQVVEGECPGCASTNAETAYWPGTTFLRARRDANGFLTVYEDLTQPGVLSAAYDFLGNVRVENDGCGGSLTAPDCSLSRRMSYTYRANSRIIDTVTRPSVEGAPVTDSRTFDGASARVVLERKEGRTAGALDGVLAPSPRTRSTRTTYGGGANLIDVTRVEGPFDDDGSGIPPANAPRTDFAYYAAGEPDACTGIVPGLEDFNRDRIKSVSRRIDATRALTTFTCDYDALGRPRETKNADGSRSRMTYDFRGNVTRTVVDATGLALTTDNTYDPLGTLVEIRLPRTTANGRAGFRYRRDDQERVTSVEQGYFTPAGGFVPLQSMHYFYDSRSNRIRTEYRDGTGATTLTEGSTLDAFNRLIALARPAGDPNRKTTNGYDAEGNLRVTGDAQGDEVFYGGAAGPTAYDRFGKLTLIEQEMCEHPASDPDGVCANPTLARVEYAYDPALQLKEVKVHDAVRGGVITTSYVTDDFGQVVRVVSPDSGTSFSLYDGAGRLIGTKDARGKEFAFTYDRSSRLLEKINQSGATPVVEVRWCYDGFDAACGFADTPEPLDEGRLSAVADKAGRVRLAYDGAGRQVEEARTFLPSGATFVTATTYDAAGNAIRVVQPNGLAIERDFDEANRETAVRWSVGAASGTILTVGGGGPGGGWYPYSGLRAWQDASGYLRFRIDQDLGGWIVATRAHDPDFVSLGEVSYGYANDGNVLRIPASEPSPNILHDSLSRLTLDRAASGGQRTYSYDDAGNRLSAIPGGAVSYPDPASDRWSSADGGAISFLFDDAGNVTTRGAVQLTTDDDGSVVAITGASGTTAYTRDHQNLRLTKAGAGGAATFLYSASGDLTQRIGAADTVTCPDSSVGPSIPYENYVYVGGRRVAMVKSHAQPACAGSTFVVDDVLLYFSDKMDLARALFRTSDGATVWRADFDAFANLLALDEDPDGDGAETRQDFRLPGQIAMGPAEGGPSLGAGGLHENWNRVYDSATGRYLEVDRWRGALRRPQSLVPYSYVEGAPLAKVDPTGLIRVRDRTDDCRECDSNFLSHWDAGLGLAQYVAGTEPCSSFFAGLDFNAVSALTVEGVSPTVYVGSAKDSVNKYYGETSPFSIRIGCRSLRTSTRQVAATLLHELAHYASFHRGFGSRFGFQGEDHAQQTGPGYDAERACFSAVVDEGLPP